MMEIRYFTVADNNFLMMGWGGEGVRKARTILSYSFKNTDKPGKKFLLP
jgi:hypothetical protein